MPAGSGSYGHTFGKVLHACIERWLKADATGRNKAGEVKEIYPDGWETVEGSTATEEDRAVIKTLISDAVEGGILTRCPDREVEKEFRVSLAPGVDVGGRIDLCAPGLVVDHKSTISMRYALSKLKLAEDTQMLLYAKVQGLPGQDVTLVHNVFERSRVQAKTTTVKVTAQQVEAHWEGLKVQAAEMQALSALPLADVDFAAVEGNMPEGCNAYGGCRFLGICTRREKPEHFRARYERLNNAHHSA